MKRTISLLLSILLLLLLLPGCAQLAATEQASRTPVFQPTATPEPATTPMETEPPADATEDGTSPGEAPDVLSSNLKDAAAFTAFPEGNYLADPKFDTDEFLPDYDVDRSLLNSTYSGICETEDTIFFFPYNSTFTGRSDAKVCILYFTDLASGVTLPLCSKPECSHTDDTCNAYLADSGQVYGLRIYDGKLYWLTVEISSNVYVHLNRMNLDGSAHEVVTTLDSETSKKLTRLHFTTWLIHRGYIYIGGYEYSATELIEPYQFYVYAAPMDGGESFSIMSYVRDSSGAVLHITPVGNDLYISLNAYRRDGETEDYCMGAFYRWNSKTRKGEYLFGQEGVLEDCLAYFGAECPYPVAGDGLYFCRSIYNGDTESFHSAVRKISFQTGKLEEISVFQSPSLAILGQEGIVSHDASCVYVYDYSFQLLSQSDPANLSLLFNFLGATSRYAFYLYGDTPDSGAIIAVPLHGGDVMFLQAPKAGKRA